MAKISVLGAGSWGTALSLLLYNNGHEVTLWSALEYEVEMLREKREHTSKLPGVILPAEMEITTDLEKSLKEPDVAVLAVPSPFTRSTPDGAVCERESENRKCGKRRGRKDAYDAQ